MGIALAGSVGTYRNYERSTTHAHSISLGHMAADGFQLQRRSFVLSAGRFYDFDPGG